MYTSNVDQKIEHGIYKYGGS